jgi:hypothetical protein
MKKIWEDIDKALLGGITIVLFFLFQFLWYVFDYNYLVPIWLLFMIAIIFYIVCIILYAFGKHNKDVVVYRLPKVKIIHVPDDLSNALTFIVEKNDLFVHETLVSIYYQHEESEIETLIGIGYIETINTNGYPQIVFWQPRNNSEKIIKKLKNNKQSRNAIKIRPSIPKEIL